MRYRGVVSWMMLTLGFVVLAYGFVSYHAWRDIAWRPTHFFLTVALAVATLGAGVKTLFRCRWATAMFLIWCAALVYYVGVWPSLSMCLIVMCAIALGSLIVPAQWSGRIWLSSLLGWMAAPFSGP